MAGSYQGNWHVLCPILLMALNFWVTSLPAFSTIPAVLCPSRCTEFPKVQLIAVCRFLWQAAVVWSAADHFLFIIKVKDAGTPQASFSLSHGTEILVRSTMLAGSEVAFSATYVLQDHFDIRITSWRQPPRYTVSAEINPGPFLL